MKIKILLSALAVLLITSCDDGLSSEAENQLKDLFDSKANKSMKASFEFNDTETTFKNDSLVILRSTFCGKDEKESHEFPVEYIYIKSSDGNAYEVATLITNGDETKCVTIRHMESLVSGRQDSITIINNALRKLQRDGQIVGSNVPITNGKFIASLPTGMWQIGEPPYPGEDLARATTVDDPNTVYMVLSDDNADKGLTFIPDINKQLVLIITKDNRERLKKHYSDDQIKEIVSSPDFSELFPEFQDLHRVSFRTTNGFLHQAKDAYCDVALIRPNGDVCYATTPDELLSQWSDNWDNLKPNGASGDGDFVGVGSYLLLKELYNEGQFIIPLNLHQKWQPVVGTDFTIYTHGLKEALKQL